MYAVLGNQPKMCEVGVARSRSTPPPAANCIVPICPPLPLLLLLLLLLPSMQLLLGMGASVNLKDYSASSPILWATYQSKLEVMKILLRWVETFLLNGWSQAYLILNTYLSPAVPHSYGADIRSQDADGLTLFHWAVKCPNVQCLKLLCKYATPGTVNIPVSTPRCEYT